MSCLFAFVVPGQPVPKARPRLGRNGHVYTPKLTRDYERLVGLCARGGGFLRPLMGPVAVTLRLWFPDRRRRDIDNSAKSILDGLNGVAYADDSQVADLHVTRHIDAADPRAEVSITTLNGVT
jgi:crossover junction endodeoxyribonuclease RusA